MTDAETDILMIGHVSRDLLVVRDEMTAAAGGAVYYGSVALRRLGVRVRVVTRLHADDWQLLDEMKAEGVEVCAMPAPQTSGMANYYSDDMEYRVCKPTGFAGAFSAVEIPAVAARVYAVVPIMAGEVDLPLLVALSRRGPLALDIQGFVRFREAEALVPRPWPDMAAGLAHVTYLKIDRAEAELLTGQSDLAVAARRLAELGPREVVATETDGVTVWAGGQIYRAPFTPRSLDGRTGRGDTCFATYLGMRLRASPAEATRIAGALTTLKLETPGPWRGTPADAEALLARRAAQSAVQLSENR